MLIRLSSMTHLWSCQDHDLRIWDERHYMSDTCPICGSVVTPQDVTCKACGFRLSGLTQEFKPVKIEEPQGAHGNTAKDMVLRMMRGPQAGVTYPLTADTITIGRNPQCDIFLNDMTVSRMHATIYHEGDSLVIRDEQSYNGIWVNNENVEMKVIGIGDFIQIGKFAFAVDEPTD